MHEYTVNDATALYVPAGHLTHVLTGVVCIVYVPALHDVQILCPNPVFTVPNEHVGHTVVKPEFPLYDPIAHSLQLTLRVDRLDGCRLYAPGGHVIQKVCPASDWYNPALQPKHAPIGPLATVDMTPVL